MDSIDGVVERIVSDIQSGKKTASYVLPNEQLAPIQVESYDDICHVSVLFDPRSYASTDIAAAYGRNALTVAELVEQRLNHEGQLAIAYVSLPKNLKGRVESVCGLLVDNTIESSEQLLQEL